MRNFLTSTDLWRTTGVALLICGLIGMFTIAHTQLGYLLTTATWFSYMLVVNILTWFEKPCEEQRGLMRRAKVLFSFQVASMLTTFLLDWWMLSATDSGVSGLSIGFGFVLMVSVMCYLGLTRWPITGT